MSEYFDAGALLRVVVVSLLLGASIPAIFALGVRALATDAPSGTRPVIRTVAGFACFALVVVAVLLGIYSIVKAKG
ncbi:hypothetical protein Cch01nite_07640 [Cellulomonas chitinilytica]|uniref:Uncharacterized protein n=1 Tax=Cellulomonas chitinilytica TaxID=398759 RepID=A0A919P0L0_9CELL|nr:hypothetical protein [Cellulomonas chitinilytica]GIG20040.1 hypothetical protein Cch01nite_07640 [Cellulomonas chitinilytica]